MPDPGSFTAPSELMMVKSTCSQEVSSAAQVVAQPTPWNGGLAAISNFGFGGTNVHCIVKGKVGNPKLLPAAEEALAPKIGSEVCHPAPSDRCHDDQGF